MRAQGRGATGRFFLTVSLLGAWCSASAEATIITGVVRNAQGNPLAGVKITFVCGQTPQKTIQVTTEKDGTYHLSEIGADRCRISAEQTGYASAYRSIDKALTASVSLVEDFTLDRLPQAGDATASPQHIQFEAAGIRGLIDPGGYSAPANAATASGLISGIADIRRTENGTTLPAAKNLPCDLEPELKKSVSADSQNVVANRQLGEFYLAHGAPSQAMSYLERAHAIDSSDPRTAEDLSEGLLLTGQFDAARQLLTALPADRQDMRFHQVMARTEEGAGRFTLASEQYRIAAEREPSEENIFGVGYELILAGRPKDAAAGFNAGLERYPQSVTLLIGSGTASFLQGKSSQAVDFFLRATDLDPANPRPYSFLVAAFVASGEQSEQVRANLKKHLDASPADSEAYYLYALALSRGRIDKNEVDNDPIESLLKRAIALDPNSPQAHFQLGTVYAHRDDYRNATREFEETLRLAPDMKEARYRLALSYRRTGNVEAANREMDSFRQAQGSKTAQNGVNLDQFISVMKGAIHPATTQITCLKDVPK